MTSGRKPARQWLLLFGVLFLAACASKNQDVPIEARPPEQIFKMAEAKITDRRSAGDAAHLFAEIERLYPYSEWAKRAIIMEAFAYHKARAYDDARAAAQRYLDFYPADEDAAYAQYLIALTYYDQIDKIGRDQGNTLKAMQALRVVFERYPDSEYAKSARLKFDLALDHLAAKEMEVGRYYLKRGFYLAAINRFRVVVQDYQTTTQTPEALYRLVESYLSLGLVNEAQTAGAILGYNFKGSSWYKDAYDLLKGKGLKPRGMLKGGGWLARIWRETVKGEWL